MNEQVDWRKAAAAGPALRDIRSSHACAAGGSLSITR